MENDSSQGIFHAVLPMLIREVSYIDVIVKLRIDNSRWRQDSLIVSLSVLKKSVKSSPGCLYSLIYTVRPLSGTY
jgi:hypothetical protein